jgi:hypothetical protein
MQRPLQRGETMVIKVSGSDPMPGLTQAGPNPPIPNLAPFPDGEAGETLAVNTFNKPDGSLLDPTMAPPSFCLNSTSVRLRSNGAEPSIG